ncbi:zinc ribbon domain-containing protein [Candidatus Pacearchaeota archaeon]|nr:zinc ribbon domain-containing protein [Candidatus Pacearchaeota archaeon]
MGKVNVCQSCGMPLNKEDNWGTNEDNSKTNEYCKFCFQDGKFSDSNLTMEKVIEKSVELSKKLWMPEDKAREIAKNTIPKLKRWMK